MSTKPSWFGPKRTGVGIQPSHPIGWLLTVLFVAVLFIGVHLALSGTLVTGLILMVASLIVYGVVIALTYSKA